MGQNRMAITQSSSCLGAWDLSWRGNIYVSETIAIYSKILKSQLDHLRTSGTEVEPVTAIRACVQSPRSLKGQFMLGPLKIMSFIPNLPSVGNHWDMYKVDH